MHSRLVSTFKKINCNYEIIFVDDGSPDNSKEIIRNISKSDTNVYVLLSILEILVHKMLSLQEC